MVVIALSGWALLGGVGLGLVAAEVWARLRGAGVSRRGAGTGPTARGLAALAALPARPGTEFEVGELICLLCCRAVDYDIRRGLFCPDCEPDRGPDRESGWEPALSRPAAAAALPSQDAAVLEPFHDRTAGPV